ncbi:hypothetical protein ACP4OV_004182 [Aristida adscensionis]
MAAQNGGGGSGGRAPVVLNVYDLTPMNNYLYWFGLGIFHSGIEGWGINLDEISNPNIGPESGILPLKVSIWHDPSDKQSKFTLYGELFQWGLSIFRV